MATLNILGYGDIHSTDDLCQYHLPIGPSKRCLDSALPAYLSLRYEPVSAKYKPFKRSYLSSTTNPNQFSFMSVIERDLELPTWTQTFGNHGDKRLLWTESRPSQSSHQTTSYHDKKLNSLTTKAPFSARSWTPDGQTSVGNLVSQELDWVHDLNWIWWDSLWDFLVCGWVGGF